MNKIKIKIIIWHQKLEHKELKSFTKNIAYNHKLENTKKSISKIKVIKFIKTFKNNLLHKETELHNDKKYIFYKTLLRYRITETNIIIMKTIMSQLCV